MTLISNKGFLDQIKLSGCDKKTLKPQAHLIQFFKNDQNGLCSRKVNARTTWRVNFFEYQANIYLLSFNFQRFAFFTRHLDEIGNIPQLFQLEIHQVAQLSSQKFQLSREKASLALTKV